MSRNNDAMSTTQEKTYNQTLGIDQDLAWLSASLSTVRFGEVGLVFIVHDGKIVRVKKVTEENHLPLPGV